MTTALDTRPLAVGDCLHGTCGGIFGNRAEHTRTVEHIGTDWAVARRIDHRGNQHLELASGRINLDALLTHRAPD